MSGPTAGSPIWRYEVFLSHNSRDKPTVERLARRLLEAGVRPWLDKWDLVPGENWLPALEAAIKASPTIAVCLGESGLGKVHDSELQVALNAAYKDQSKRVVPILLPKAAEGGADAPEFLQLKTWVDYRREDEESFRRLVSAIRGERPGPSAPDSSICPYRGLEPFRAEHSRFFYGREREVESLLEALRQGNRLLTLVGASGSGKSSLVLAGLVPAIRTGQLEGSYRWRVVSLRPGSDPGRGLAGALLELRGQLRHERADGGDWDEKLTRFLDPQSEERLRRGLLAAGAGAELMALVREIEKRSETLDDTDESRALLRRLERAARRTLSELGDEAGPTDLREDLSRLEGLRQLIARRRSGFADAVEISLPPDEKLLLVVDQFEELFTMTADPAARSSFLESLLHAVGAPDGRLFAVVTVRVDFLGKLLAEPLLAPVLQDSMRVALSVMERPQLELAIRGPAAQVGLRVDDSVVDALVDGVADEPGNLPLLQFCLLELWRARESGRITWRAYTELGGLKGAIAKRAESIFEELDEPDRPLVRRLFGRLVRLGEGTEDTRRRAPREELLEIDRERAPAVLEKLVSSRLLTAYEDEIEVAHEALIREWERLRRWIDQDREALRVRQELDQAEEIWRRGGGSESDLWRGGRLDRAVELREASRLELSQAEQRFLDASWQREKAEQEQRREHRRRELEAARELAEVQAQAARRLGRAAKILGLGGAIAVALGAVSFLAYREAGAQREKARVIALGQAAGSAVQDRLPDRALLLALEAVEADPAPEQMQFLLQAVALAQKSRVLPGHSAPVSTLAFSPDGRMAATGSWDRTARLWDLQRPGGAQAVLAGHQDHLTSVAFSPDGSQVVTASSDQTARIWTSQGRELVRLAGHRGAICCAAFSPDGRSVLTASEDSTARLWSSDGNQVTALEGHGLGLTSAAFSPDGELVATGSKDRTARIWARSGELVAELEGHSAPVVSVVFVGDGKRLLTGSWDATARLWDLEGRALGVLGPHNDGLYGASASADGRWLATASIDGTARLWSAAGALISELRGHRSGVVSAMFSPHADLLATASLDGSAWLWKLDPEAGRASKLMELQGHGGPVLNATFSPSGRLLATASEDGTAQLWDTSGRQPDELRGHAGPVNSAVFSPDGRRLLTASEDRSARLWDDEGRQLRSLDGHQDGVIFAEFSPDGAILLTLSKDFTARLWTEAGEPLATLQLPASPWAAQFRPDGERILTASQDDAARIWDLAGNELCRQRFSASLTGFAIGPGGRVATSHEDRKARIWEVNCGGDESPWKLLFELSGHELPLWSVDFSPDGRLLATASEDNTARIWSAEGEQAGEELAVLRGHSAAVWSVRFSPDGKLLATGSADRTARIWRPDGTHLYTLGGREIGALWADFSPDSARVVTGSWEGTARIWHIDPAGLIATARDRLRRDFTRAEIDRYHSLLSERTRNRAESALADFRPASASP